MTISWPGGRTRANPRPTTPCKFCFLAAVQYNAGWRWWKEGPKGDVWKYLPSRIASRRAREEPALEFKEKSFEIELNRNILGYNDKTHNNKRKNKLKYKTQSTPEQGCLPACWVQVETVKLGGNLQYIFRRGPHAVFQMRIFLKNTSFNSSSVISPVLSNRSIRSELWPLNSWVFHKPQPQLLVMSSEMWEGSFMNSQ